MGRKEVGTVQGKMEVMGKCCKGSGGPRRAGLGVRGIIQLRRVFKLNPGHRKGGGRAPCRGRVILVGPACNHMQVGLFGGGQGSLEMRGELVERGCVQGVGPSGQCVQ